MRDGGVTEQAIGKRFGGLKKQSVGKEKWPRA